jgi:hypothetical protein
VLVLLAAVLAANGEASGESLRIATWHAPLSREGPGLLLRDILAGERQVMAVIERIAALRPDILLLTNFDWDSGAQALDAFAARLQAAGLTLPYRLSRRPNAGWRTPLDIDGDGRRGTPRDARGYGRFSGAGGLALFSRLRLDEGMMRDFTALRWAELPGHLLSVEEARRAGDGGPWLSSTAHWDVPVILPGGARLHLLAFAATAPVFDGPEDFNGRRNHDEIAFWHAYLDGRLATPPPGAPVVVLGLANLDPADGEGRHEAIRTLAAHPRLQDARPRSEAALHAARRQAGANARHRGDPALDTADLDDAEDGPGNLRLSYILPDRRLTVTSAGVAWPRQPEPQSARFRHHLVWVDVDVPEGHCAAPETRDRCPNAAAGRIERERSAR